MAELPLDDRTSHYLKNVLRRNVRDPVRPFNARDGEFDAVISSVSKKSVVLTLGAQRRPATDEPDLTLLFAPLKRGPTEYLLQKGVELGVATFLPVLTERTNNERLRLDRLTAICVEAAEQCERLSVPDVLAPQSLMQTLDAWEPTRPLIFCDEAGDDPLQEWGGGDGRAAPFLEGLNSVPKGAPGGLLVGPEGGFSPAERADLRSRPFVRPATLGPRILRADTAAIIAVGLWQAVHGDLQRT